MSVRTVTLPTQAGASWDDFAWESKAAADTLPFVLDLTDWLENAGLDIDQIDDVQASPDLTVASVALEPPRQPTQAVLRLSGGTPGTIPRVRMLFDLSGPEADLADDTGTILTDDAGLDLAQDAATDELDVTIALPIRLGPPAGLVSVTGLDDDAGGDLEDDNGNSIAA